MAHHAKFFARTILVRNNDVDTAYKALDKYFLFHHHIKLIKWHQSIQNHIIQG